MTTLEAARKAPAIRMSRLEGATFLLLNLLGLVAYLHPFVVASATERDSAWFDHATDGPVIFAALAALCMVLVVAELTGGGLNSKSLAVLGVMAALAAALRTVSLPAGANLYFFLVILGSYVFGVRLGFLLGALSFFLSAVVTGGIGPWLPFQMFASGWMGMTAGATRPAAERLGLGRRGEAVLVVGLGVVWGLLFGAITNLWFWPFWAGGPDISYEPGLGLPETLRRYWNFYLVTSFGWDLLRCVCNGLVLAILGGPLLRAMSRFRDRFQWETAVTFEPEPATASR